VALLAFLLLCTPDERMRALRRPISGAAVYFAGTVGFAIYCIQLGFGVSRIHLGLYQCACTFAGWVAGAAPLLTLLVSSLALLCFAVLCSLFCPLQVQK
jgi:hypothetical protein